MSEAAVDLVAYITPSIQNAVHVRPDIVREHRRVWKRLGTAGAWLTGAEKCAVAAETRHAVDCRLCAEKKQALSPNHVEGTHDGLGMVPANWLEVIHAIRNDPGRLNKRWFDARADDGMSAGVYVEILSTLAHVLSIDTFCHGIGVAPFDLPEPIAGAPSHYTPVGLQTGIAWVPMISPNSSGPNEADLYAGNTAAFIRRAMSTAPDEVRSWFGLLTAQYLSAAEMFDFSQEFRAINHAQIELLAARVSALNQCLY